MMKRGTFGIFSIMPAFALLYGCGNEQREPANRVPSIEFWIQTQSADPIRYEAGLMIAENWRELGFDVDTQTREWSSMSAEGMKAHEHQAFMVKYGGKPERVDPYHWLYTMHHSSNTVEGGSNVAGYSNPAYDALADEFASNMDIDARRDAALGMQAILARDVPQPPMFKLKLKNAYNRAKFTNVTPGIGLGVYSFWNFMNITPLTDDTILNLGQVSDINLLNPLTTKTGQDIYMLKNIYDPLVRLDVNGEAVNWLASQVSMIDDTTIDVEIRDDFRFHDGVPLTVEDVKFTFDFARELKAPTYWGHVRNIESVEITGPRTLRFTLTDSYAPFISNTLSQCLILPRPIWNARYPEKGAEAVLTGDNLPPVGSGPFVFDYWRPNEEFALKVNTEYFRQPEIEGIVRTPYAQILGLVQGLLAEQVELTSANMLPRDLEEVTRNPNIEIVELPDEGSYVIHYNMRKKPFDDVYARRALTLAIPRQLVISAVLDGGGIPTFSLVPTTNTFWFNDSVEKLDFDMERARGILEKAGYTWDKEGRIHYPDNFEPTAVLPG